MPFMVSVRFSFKLSWISWKPYLTIQVFVFFPPNHYDKRKVKNLNLSLICPFGKKIQHPIIQTYIKCQTDKCILQVSLCEPLSAVRPVLVVLNQLSSVARPGGPTTRPKKRHERGHFGPLLLAADADLQLFICADSLFITKCKKKWNKFFVTSAVLSVD